MGILAGLEIHEVDWYWHMVSVYDDLVIRLSVSRIKKFPYVILLLRDLSEFRCI